MHLFPSDRPSFVRTPLRCRMWLGDLALCKSQLAAVRSENRRLSAALREEKRRRLADERRWRAEERRLRTALSDAKASESTLRTTLRGTFTAKQLASLKSGRRVNWEKEDIVRALTLRCSSRKCYRLLREKFGFPLPGLTTLRSWTRGFRTTPGLLEMSLAIMRSLKDGMTSHERLVVLSFDELSIDQRISLDLTDDAVYGPHSKMQVMMVRSLCSHWKQPVYFQFSEDMTKDILFRCIAAIEETGYVVVAMVCDLGPQNRRLIWSPKSDGGLGIDPEDAWFEHPCDSERYVYT